MFGGAMKWLEKKAGNQSLYNIKIVTSTLIMVSNKADKAIQESGRDGIVNLDYADKVNEIQRDLLTDMALALENKKTKLEIKETMKSVMLKHLSDGGHISHGAEMALNHVIQYLDKEGIER